MTHDLPFAPCIIVVTEDEKLITVLDTDKYLGIDTTKAEPLGAAAPATKAPIESSGDNKV